MTSTLSGKVAVITGASRGVGKAVALTLAEHGVNLAVGAKTVESTDKTPGTIYDTVAEVEAKGAKAIAVQTDVRHEEDIKRLVDETVKAFGRIDIVVNNAGAIMWLPVEELPVKRFDLMMQLNYRAPFILCHYAIPHLKKQGGHVVNMSPPPKIGGLATEDWRGKTGYLMSKFGMSHLTMGLAEELRADKVSVNSVWPANIIDTQATRVFASMFKMDEKTKWYSPQLLADATFEIVNTPPGELTGQTLIAEEYLQQRTGADISKYEVPSPL